MTKKLQVTQQQVKSPAKGRVRTTKRHRPEHCRLCFKKKTNFLVIKRKKYPTKKQNPNMSTRWQHQQGSHSSKNCGICSESALNTSSDIKCTQCKQLICFSCAKEMSKRACKCSKCGSGLPKCPYCRQPLQVNRRIVVASATNIDEPRYLSIVVLGIGCSECIEVMLVRNPSATTGEFTAIVACMSHYGPASGSN
jgi:hypothetical protein